MKRAGAVSLVLLAAACTGLLVDKGNDFPCDFRAPEGQRDQACAPDEVCGVDNHCRPFHFEGPQFEGRPLLPRFDATAKLHPGALSGNLRALAVNGQFADPSGRQQTLLAVTAVDQGLRAWVLDLAGAAGASVGTPGLDGGLLASLVTAAQASRARTLIVAQNGADTVTLQFVLGVAVPELVRDPAPGPGLGPLVNDIRELRTLSGKVAALRGDVRGYSAGLIGELLPRFEAFGGEVRLGDGGTSDAGVRPWDLTLAEWRSFGPLLNADAVALALDAEGLKYQLPRTPLDGGEWVSLHDNADEGLELGALAGPLSRLRTDPTGQLVAVVGGASTAPLHLRRTLSTWSLVRAGPSEVVAARAWPDCRPCGDGRILAVAPSLEGRAAVEVICSTGKASLSVVAVTGSTASAASQACTSEPLEPPFDLRRLAAQDTRLDFSGVAGVTAADLSELPQDNAMGRGVAFGGAGGRIYLGGTYSRALPLFLDRLPQSVGTFPAPDGGALLVALTDRFPALRLSSEGFETLDLSRALRVPVSGIVPSALVGEAPGWMVVSSGDVLRLAVQAGDAGVPTFSGGFGPRLLDSSDQPAKAPFFAEAVTDTAGAVTAMVLTAFDSVYLASGDLQAQLTDTLNAQAPLRPALTPEPNSPIRSFALERSVLGTDGTSRVRGYAATARNLYLVQLGGTPPRWTATPLVLTGESPVEAWMDHPRGGLGRAGYPSGEVYTLPGAFLLARSLDESGVLRDGDGGAQVAVSDYENLGGWPAAYSRDGVFVAYYDELPDGGLDNKDVSGRLGKPMTWKRARLADGGEPWRGKPGRLYALKSPRTVTASYYGAASYREDWTLVVFTPDEAWEVAHTARSNLR